MRAILSTCELWDTTAAADARSVAIPDPANAGQHIVPTAAEIQVDKKRCRCIVFYCLQHKRFSHGDNSTCHHNRGRMDGLEKLVRDHKSHADLESRESTREPASDYKSLKT